MCARVFISYCDLGFVNKMSPALIKTSPSYCFVQRNSQLAICPSFLSTELGPDMFSLQTIIGCFV